MRVAIATCKVLPEPDPDETLVLSQRRRRGRGEEAACRRNDCRRGPRGLRADGPPVEGPGYDGGLSRFQRRADRRVAGRPRDHVGVLLQPARIDRQRTRADRRGRAAEAGRRLVGFGRTQVPRHLRGHLPQQ